VQDVKRQIAKMHKDQFIYYNSTLTHTLCWKWALDKQNVEIRICGVLLQHTTDTAVRDPEVQDIVNSASFPGFNLALTRGRQICSPDLTHILSHL
jgi:hypothetical protein